MESFEVMPIRTQITSVLRKAIYSGEYQAGQELSLTEVAAKLGISRTPVREAFQTLDAEGLITLRMNKGAIVNRIDEKFIRDAFEMRILLESEAAARAAERGMETESLLSRLVRMDENIDHISTSEYESLNRDIHTGIWTAADNKNLYQYLMDLWNGPSTGHTIPETNAHYRHSTKEHLQILSEIRDKNAEGARLAMKKHIERSMNNIVALYQNKEHDTK